MVNGVRKVKQKTAISPPRECDLEKEKYVHIPLTSKIHNVTINVQIVGKKKHIAMSYD